MESADAKDTEKLDANQVVEALKAVADSTRMHLLLLCRRCDLSVSELTWILGQTQPGISRHLKQLCDAGLLDRYAERNRVIYRHAMGSDLYQIGEVIDALTASDIEPTAGYLDRLEQVRASREEKVQAFFSSHAGEWAKMSRLQVSERDVETAFHAVLGQGHLGTMVDMGTGTGRMLAILGARTGRAIGVDMNAEMLAVARQNLDRPDFRHIQVRQGDIRKLPLEAGSADLVTAHQVLHYLDDPDQVVREAARVLRPGGRIVIADLMPHQMESLTTEQAHRRLGFSNEEIQGWFVRANLVPGQFVKLSGAPLPVGVWSATKTLPT